MMSFRGRLLLTLLLPTSMVHTARADESPDTLVVSVASSMTDVMESLRDRFEATHPHIKVQLNFGGSDWLTRQIEAGAAVDVLIAAGRKPIDTLVNAELLAPEDVTPVAGNRIVLVGRKNNNTSFHSLSNVQRIAIGQPGVPVGDYARQVLQHTGQYDAIKDRLVLAANAQQVSTYVSNGDVDVGIVFATDAAIAKITILDEAPTNSHDPIVYPAVVLHRSVHRETAAAFVTFLTTPDGRSIFASHGFKPPPTIISPTEKTVQERPTTSVATAMALSIKAATGAMLFVIPIGIAIGWWLSRTRFFARDIIDAFVTLPLILPPTATGYFLMGVLGGDSSIGRFLADSCGLRITLTLLAAGIASAIIALPLMVLSAKAAFAQVDRNLEWTSMTLGAGRWRTFCRITVPLARHGLLAGVVLSFARAIGEFGATFMLAGMIPGRTMTAPLAIFHAFTNHDDTTAKTIVLTLSAFSILVIVLANRLHARAQKQT